MPATQADIERLGVWHKLLNPDTNIDPRTRQRTVPMEVLNVSLPRTGTLSMHEAFRILGYADPYHFASIAENARDADMWDEAMDAKFRNSKNTGLKPYTRHEFDQLLGHCGAVNDTPCCLFWRELMDVYPDAKVVLVEREEEKWLASIRVLMEGCFNPVGRYVLRYTEPTRFGRIAKCGLNWIDCMFDCQGDIRLEKAMANARKTYRDHNAAVKAAVPKERLLVYRLGSGWEPLCKFLGKDTPKVPFPHMNDAKTLEIAFGVLVGEALKKSLVNIAMVVGVAALSFEAVRRFVLA
jgi:hypothetical protein